MNEHIDPRIEALFDSIEPLPVDDAFTDAVVRKIQTRRSRVLFTRGFIVVSMIALEVLLGSPLQESLGVVAIVLNQPLFPLGNEWLTFLLTPVNSVAGLLGMILLGLSYLYRKMSL